MRMRLAYCAAAVSPSSADAYYETASFVYIPPPYRPHLLYYSSITNWIGVVPYLFGFLVIISCVLYCGRNRCMNITDRVSTGEISKTSKHEAMFNGVHLEEMHIACLSTAFDLSHLPDYIFDLRRMRDQYHTASNPL
jgi:hypothetical protein